MAKLFGLEIKRIVKQNVAVSKPLHKFVPDAHEKYLWIKEMGIKTVLDIGAHEGKTAIGFLELFPEAEIYSFEPIPQCYEKLVERTKAHERCKAFNLAMGEASGTIEFHQSSYSPSSSILPMAKAHETAFPFTEGGTKLEVTVTTLDDFFEKEKITRPLAIKIDVQGYEWQVIKGGNKTLEKAKLHLIETSFVELYKNQKLFAELYTTLTNQGFVYAGSFDQLYDPQNGKPIQQDAIFIRQ